MPILTKEHTFEDGTIGRAVFSDDMKYRYMLSRIWGKNPSIIFIMLNPSIGDERSLESTTAGCMSRAKKWNYGGLLVYNLFAYISTDPKQLAQVEDPVGPYNNFFIQHINEIAATAGSTVVCAWGKHGSLRDRDMAVLDQLFMPLHVLEENQDGTPRHPLHMSHKIEPRPWGNES